MGVGRVGGGKRFKVSQLETSSRTLIEDGPWEDLSLDEDSDEEIARRKRSPLSLSPPSPSSRKRSSPKKQTPPRAARSPLRALSAYFGNKKNRAASSH